MAEGAGEACCGADACASHAKADTLRAPVRACVDALVAAGARVETVTAHDDKDIDAVLARFDAPARPDGLTWPDGDSKTRLVVAAATDGQLRHVVRRLVRRYAPAPSRRPADLAGNRTVPDLPALGVLPMGPASRDLVSQLGLPRDPAAVAAAVLDGPVKRLDLLRNDAGSVTLDGALIGGRDENMLLPWRGRVEVDDAVLSDGDDPVLACAVGNAAGYADLDGLPLLTGADPTSGQLEVAVAVPVVSRTLLGRPKARVEVRRARGRAVAVLPRDEEIPFVDDGVKGTLTRKRSWWIEPGAWAVYTH
ncbi:diacylglycerol kinase family protein [Asanoa sp. NPDC049573]|uniref:diacylglycerol kinase family protein n=1 Tax=Asanoa sp. NPDC049573 TaxID=3155396 RepID=UPI00342435C2